MPPASLPPPPVGWPLLPLPDERGELHYPTAEASAKQAIEVILRTRAGEQLMRPEFGASLESFVHEQNTLSTRRSIKDLVTDALERWEPRIAVERVEVSEDAARPSVVRVEIGYRLRQTGVAQRVGLSMSLDG